MSNNYILLKVNGGWIDREQIKGLLKMFFDDPRVEIVENGLVAINSTDKVSRVGVWDYNAKDVENFTKDRIANSLGFFLLEEGLIHFQKDISSEFIKTTGSVLVVKDHANEKEGEQK